MNTRPVRDRNDLVAQVIDQAPKEWSTPEVAAAVAVLMETAILWKIGWGEDWGSIWPEDELEWKGLAFLGKSRDPAGNALGPINVGSFTDVVTPDELTASMTRLLTQHVPELPPELREVWAPHFTLAGAKIGLTTATQWAEFQEFCWSMMADVDYGGGQKPRPF